ncbi:phytase [Arenibacter sp. GZD96]|uniref:phytase n=1 Tax=Aurantibrevibacter litoralis TaxID=3106030 RepID=UPI002AFDE461|nr:phytase [Arenibacter sp. GZD-96]MEA1786575.1 phytase [Arenibacter sp. GZD-96]
MTRCINFAFLVSLVLSCNQNKLPEILPDIITEHTINDTDDPAIWINRENPGQSIVFGTDKDTNGAIYAFDLNGKILETKTIRNLKRPNNVDIEYGFSLNDSTFVDILVFTEREKQQIGVFSVPDMQPLDNGGFAVFSDVSNIDQRLPMGIGLYKSPKDGTIYAIVSRKTGALENYLYQYALRADSTGVRAELVRKFGKFSGRKEIEAIAVDDANSIVYYADEGACIRKYYAEPAMGNAELNCFGGAYFLEDIEGIAIATYHDGAGYLIVSDQQRGQFNVFSKEDNRFIKALNLGTVATDGCEVVTFSLGENFPNGLFVAMNDEKNFYFYDLAKLHLE